MSELEQLVDHVIFILDGNIRYYGSMQNLLDESEEDRLEAAIARMMDTPSEENDTKREPGTITKSQKLETA